MIPGRLKMHKEIPEADQEIGVLPDSAALIWQFVKE
jgi:hypothetical protein